MSRGEGSRGGHIIGHTKSGAPIYGSASDHAAKVDKGKPHDMDAASESKSVGKAGAETDAEAAQNDKTYRASFESNPDQKFKERYRPEFEKMLKERRK